MSVADDGGAGEPEKQSHLYKVAFAAYSCDVLRRSTQPRAQVLVIGDYAVGCVLAGRCASSNVAAYGARAAKPR